VPAGASFILFLEAHFQASLNAKPTLPIVSSFFTVFIVLQWQIPPPIPRRMPRRANPWLVPGLFGREPAEFQRLRGLFQGSIPSGVASREPLQLLSTMRSNGVAI